MGISFLFRRIEKKNFKIWHTRRGLLHWTQESFKESTDYGKKLTILYLMDLEPKYLLYQLYLLLIGF